MGIFDYLRCEYDIGVPKDTQFLTKCFDDPYIDRYLIDKKGRLFKLIKLDNYVYEQVFYRGDILFGGYVGETWHIYSALFDGNLLNIKRINTAPTDAALVQRGEEMEK
jgi:hypothetical protein